MKKIEKYQCAICKRLYDTEDSAIICEMRGIVPQKANVGDAVYIKAKYTPPEAPFVERTITGVYTENRHVAEYQFDRPVEVASSTYIGSWDELALQHDFYLIGEKMDCLDFEGKVMSLDFVSP